MKRKLIVLAIACGLLFGASPAPAMASSAGACSHSITTTKHWKSYPWKHQFSYSPINSSYHRVYESVFYLDSYSHMNIYTCPT